MSMLRFLAPAGSKGKIRPPTRGTPATSTSSDSQLKMKVIVPNYGIIYLPAPEAPREDGTESEEPRDDPMLHGELELTVPAGSGQKRCKSIRVGLKTVITLDLGQGRRFEEDVLFERKVEIISSTADGIWLSEGTQKFDFTIIVPANLASHDWHTNGVISHVLYAEVEGLPGPEGWGVGKAASPSTSMFNLRRPGGSRSASRGGSPRGGSPTASPPLSPSMPPRMVRTPSRASFALGSPTSTNGALPIPTSPTIGCGANMANLNLGSSPSAYHQRQSSVASNGGGGGQSPLSGSPVGSPRSTPIPIPMGGGTRPNPAHISAAQSLSITRQEAPMLPRAPSYDDSMGSVDKTEGAAAKSDWITGMHTTKRNCMVVYNPNPSGGVNQLSERANGYIDGLGMWELQMVSDVWCIGALLSVSFKLSQLSAATTVYSIKLLLNQTHSIVSPRDIGGEAKHVSTRTFTLLEEGKRPDKGYHFPDKRHPALWRGKAAGGEDDPAVDDEIVVDKKARMPNDNVARPSTLPGVVTPISVSHTMALEVAFSVWGEDDLGQAMERPSHGGLRVLKVSRPVFVPSCCLVPAVLDLPTYESHAKDRVAGEGEALPPGLPGWEWCSCGWQIAELEARMRQSIFIQQAEANAAADRRRASVHGTPSGSTISTTRSSEEDMKLLNERGRQGSR